MPILDILLDSKFDRITVIASLVGMLASSGIFAYAKSSKVRGICIIYFSLNVYLLIFCTFFFPNAHVYRLLRQQSEPATLTTYEIASNFNRGYYEFVANLYLGYFLVFLFFTFVIAILLVPMFILIQDFTGIIDVSMVLSILLLTMFYILTFYGNCAFFWINPQIQYISFGHTGPPIVSSLVVQNQFGNQCKIITIDEINNITEHPFTTSESNTKLHWKGELERVKHDEELAKILSFNLPWTWLSPTADITGVVMAIYAIIGGLVSMIKKSKKAQGKANSNSQT